jgi:hypothetical protein
MFEHATPLSDGLVSCGHIGFGYTYGAGGGERCDRKDIQLHARFVDKPDAREAQLNLSVTYIYGSKRHITQMGTMTLAPMEARALALAIAPPAVKRAFDGFPHLAQALRDMRARVLNDQGVTLADIDAALSAAGVAVE